MIYIKDKQSFLKFIAYIAAVAFAILFIIANVKFGTEIVAVYVFIILGIVAMGTVAVAVVLLVILGACELAKRAFGMKKDKKKDKKSKM